MEITTLHYGDIVIQCNKRIANSVTITVPGYPGDTEIHLREDMVEIFTKTPFKVVGQDYGTTRLEISRDRK